METQVLSVESYQGIRSNAPKSETQPMSFVGEELATSIQYAADDTWERKETLYRATDGRLLVYVQDRSKTLTSAYSLHEATMADLVVGGRFAGLGQGWWFMLLPDADDGGRW
jgi:hypothetical protein